MYQDFLFEASNSVVVVVVVVVVLDAFGSTTHLIYVNADRRLELMAAVERTKFVLDESRSD